MTRGEIGVLLRVIGEALVVERGTFPRRISGSPSPSLGGPVAALIKNASSLNTLEAPFIEFAAAVKCCLLDLQGSQDSPHFGIHYGQAELVKFAAFDRCLFSTAS